MIYPRRSVEDEPDQAKYQLWIQEGPVGPDCKRCRCERLVVRGARWSHCEPDCRCEGEYKMSEIQSEDRRVFQAKNNSKCLMYWIKHGHHGWSIGSSIGHYWIAS